jgi:hypothetical protein
LTVTNGVPDGNFALSITRGGKPGKIASEVFKRSEPSLEKWLLSYAEDLFAQDARVIQV